MVVSSDIVSLNEPSASSGLMPIAMRTWEGPAAPVEHALPAEAQIPWESSIERSCADSTPGKQKDTLFGSLICSEPVRTTILSAHTKAA